MSNFRHIRTCVPDFDRAWAVIATSRHDFRSIWRECDGIDHKIVGVLLLALQLECACQGSQKWSVLGKEGRFEAQIAPASQTLIVPGVTISPEAEQIFVPSGENATELIWESCAFVFSLFSSSVPAWEVTKRQFWARRGDLRPKRTRIPDFDRLVKGSGHNFASIGREVDRVDAVAVRVALLALQFQCGCRRQAGESVDRREGRFPAQRSPESQTLIV